MDILEKSMWTVCWEDSYGERFWEVISGEDAMHQRVNELVKLAVKMLCTKELMN
jgi:hypothetical protein